MYVCMYVCIYKNAPDIYFASVVTVELGAFALGRLLLLKQRRLKVASSSQQKGFRDSRESISVLFLLLMRPMQSTSIVCATG